MHLTVVREGLNLATYLALGLVASDRSDEGVKNLPRTWPALGLDASDGSDEGVKNLSRTWHGIRT